MLLNIFLRFLFIGFFNEIQNYSSFVQGRLIRSMDWHSLSLSNIWDLRPFFGLFGITKVKDLSMIHFKPNPALTFLNHEAKLAWLRLQAKFLCSETWYRLAQALSERI